MERELCRDCDAPLATTADGIESERHVPNGGCECLICAALCWREWHGDVCQREAIDWPARCASLRSALATCRAEAIEECAKVCEDYETWLRERDHHGDPRAATGAMHCAQRIRALSRPATDAKEPVRSPAKEAKDGG